MNERKLSRGPIIQQLELRRLFQAVHRTCREYPYYGDSSAVDGGAVESQVIETDSYIAR